MRRFIISLCFSPLFTISLGFRQLGDTDQCIPRDPKTLRSDQITVLINGYSESRIPLLRSIAATYAAIPSISSVIILWGNPSTKTLTLTQLSQNLTESYGAPITLIRQPTSSLNARFLPHPSIQTRAVIICDDDIEPDPKSIDFAFKIWGINKEKIVGFFARSHDMDLSIKSWIYTVHPDKYSIMLTKFMILKLDYLYMYSCNRVNTLISLRGIVDEMNNCEDILMNFVVAEAARSGPVLVGAKKVRDWGDARNDEEGEKGLSSRVGDHRKRRGECLRRFHGVLGRMPLRYSYGKVVNSVGEQGLCKKGGKLVFCDEQIV